MKFVIDRSKWRAGDKGDNMIGKGRTRLLNSNGFMCCLGQCENQLGVSNENLFGFGSPKNLFDIDNIFNETAPWGSVINTALSIKAMRINDDGLMQQKERERRLRELFKENGHQIVFKGKAVI